MSRKMKKERGGGEEVLRFFFFFFYSLGNDDGCVSLVLLDSERILFLLLPFSVFDTAISIPLGWLVS
jgi:hypothetical protein